MPYIKNKLNGTDSRAFKYARSLADFLLIQADTIFKGFITTNKYNYEPRSQEEASVLEKVKDQFNRLLNNQIEKDEKLLLPPESDIELINQRKSTNPDQGIKFAGALDKPYREK